ncbi:MAG: hypothetical protein ACFFCX_12255 [Candidatus Sifarchaeia archaeon]
MSMSKRVSVSLLSIIFLVALVSAIPVEAKTPIRWDVTAEYVGYYTYPDWVGEILGEDATIGMFISEVVFLSNGQKLVVDWWIDFIDGGHLEGTVHGFFVYETHNYLYDGGQYVLNGKVTDTSPDWSHLNGRNVHIMGIITPWPWFTEGTCQIN